MKVLMVLNQEFPPVNRVEKEALSLLEHGFEVILLSLRHNEKLAKYEEYKGIKIHRITIHKKLFDKLHASYLINPLYKWFMYRAIRKHIEKYKVEALHIHNLPLTDVGVKLRDKYSIKLVCDQHEYYSNWIVRTAHYNTNIGRMVKRLSNWKRYEQKYLPLADLVISIEEPLRRVYIEEVGVDPERVIGIPNTPRESIFNGDNINYDIVNQYKDKFVLFYAGGITVLKGIKTVIKALSILEKEIPNIQLVLGGKISKYTNPLDEADEIGVNHLLEFVGWIPVDKIPSYIYSSDICFHVPPVYNEEVNRTIQTKIYQYIKMGKPLIVGQARMAREFVTKNQLGFSIKENDSGDFADKVLKMYKDPDLYNTLSNNCKNTAKKYSWEKTIQSLINFYKKALYE